MKFRNCRMPSERFQFFRSEEADKGRLLFFFNSRPPVVNQARLAIKKLKFSMFLGRPQ